MKLSKVKRIFVTSLLLLGMISMLGGCGGNKGNSDFTKEEMDEIDALFSDDERKELEAELGGGDFDSSSKKEVEVTYDETLTIDPFEGVTAIISGTEPYNTNIRIVEPESEYKDEYYKPFWVNITDGVDTKMLTVGDTVSVTLNTHEIEQLEKKLQKNVEFTSETAELEIVQDTEYYLRFYENWNEFTEEQKNELINAAKTKMEEEIGWHYSSLFSTEDYEPNPFGSDVYDISDPVGIYYCSTYNEYGNNNCVSIGFDVTNDEDRTMTVYSSIGGILLNENTGELEYWTGMMFSTAPGVTDITVFDEASKSLNDPEPTDENFKSEYISLR